MEYMDAKAVSGTVMVHSGVAENTEVAKRPNEHKPDFNAD